MIPRRKGDIAIILLQNSAKKLILIDHIAGVHSEVEYILGYTMEELQGKPLQILLPPQINEMIDDYVEYDDFGNDLVSVLSKCRDFSIVSKGRQEVSLGLRIQRDVSPDEHPRYVMILHDKVNQSLGALMAQEYQAGEMSELSEASGLPDKIAFLQNAEVIHFSLQNDSVRAVLALIAIDKFQLFSVSYGPEKTEQLLKEVAARAMRSFRLADVIGYLGEGVIAVILLETNAETAKIPLNRLRWEIASQPLYLEQQNDVIASVSIAYTTLTKNGHIQGSIEDCERILRAKKEEGGNVIVEA